MKWFDIETAPKDRPILVTWRGALTRVKFRIAVWQDKRPLDDGDFGAGFTCYWAGVPLGEMWKWAELPEAPQ